MKCLLVSDLHYGLKQFDWVLSTAADFDVVILAGDHLDITSNVDIRAQSTVVLKYLRRLSPITKTIVCSGNHDLDSRSPNGEKVARWLGKVRQLGIPTDFESLEVGEVLFTICPWWDGPVTRDEVGAHIARDRAKVKGKWIWVYHAPPDQSPTSWGGRKYFGDAQLSAWIEEFQPDMVLTGHIHQSPFSAEGSWVDRLGSTWVFNSGRYRGPEPAHITFDTDAEMAVWFSLAGAEYVQLDRALERPVAELTELPAWLTSSDRDRDPSPG